MSLSTTHHTDSRDLVISRVLNVSRAALWRAWSEQALLQQWWCPAPWTTQVLALDLQAGGAFHTLMSGPDGGVSDNPGSFLDVVAERRLVFTSMVTAGWRPATPWLAFTAIITLEDEGQGCRYTAQVLHPDDAVRAQHEELGFFEGWNIAITQLEAVAAALE